MVARVDHALKDDLNIADGLAAENVFVLDPCCGTGAYLAEVLRRIAANLKDKGLGALIGARVKKAATERVFGFEIMPAPFVVAHLQVGLTMQALDAPSRTVGFRHLWGGRKREELTATAESEPSALYDSFEPSLPLGLPFAQMAVSDEWHKWSSLPDLFPKSFPGVHTGRDRFLIDIDLDHLRARIADYFNPALSDEEIARLYPAAMRNSSAFNPQDARMVRKPESTEGGRLVSILKWPEGAPLNLG